MSQQKNRAREALMCTCISGAMIGLAIVFCRLLGFPTSGIWRVELSFLPIAVVAYLFGPIASGVSYGAADLIGAALTTGINPFITLEKVFLGALMGLFFHRKGKIGAVRITATMFAGALLFDFAMMVLIFRFAFLYEWGTAFIARGANAGVNFVLRVVVLILCDRYLFPILDRERSRIYG